MFDKVFLQRNYAALLSSRLNLHKVQQNSPYVSNFRCDICGDSQKNKFKRRGYIIEKSSSLFYFCHNCGASHSLENYLKNHHPDLYSQYRLDIIREINDDMTNYQDKEVESKPREIFQSILDFPYVIPAKDSKEAIKYIRERKIPSERINDIYFSEYFKKFINEIIPSKFPTDEALKRDARIIFPIRSSSGELLGCVGRTIENSYMRYYSVKFTDSPIFFNLDRIDRTKPVFCTEGPIDSLFLDNCFALCGSDRGISDYFSDLSEVTIILDNQPRNKEIVKIYTKYISWGFNIFIWPDGFNEKDINEVIMNKNLDKTKIHDIIEQNSFRGIRATMRLNQWKRI